MEIKVNEQRSSIKLNKGITGKYGWEIKIYDEDLEKTTTEIKKYNDILVKEFNGGQDDKETNKE